MGAKGKNEEELQPDLSARGLESHPPRNLFSRGVVYSVQRASRSPAHVAWPKWLDMEGEYLCGKPFAFWPN